MMKLVDKCFKCLKKNWTFVIFLSILSCYYLVQRQQKGFQLQVNMHKVRKETWKTKYILLWTKESSEEWRFLQETDAIFMDNNCKFDNCFITTDRKFFGNDTTKFDAIIINGRYIVDKHYRLPEKRSSKQLYIFATRESAANYPVCDKKYDNFFNLTWTYRLDSDIPWPFFVVYDFENVQVAPSRNKVNWTKVYEPPIEEFNHLYAEKENIAIWIVSNCFTGSRRESLFYGIDSVLKRNNLKVDVVGFCGNIQCPLEMEHDCLKTMFKYYFFFAFENSLSEDYVTEKVLKAFENYVVPVVFGEVDFDKFLPPHSYIDAGKLGPVETAKTLEAIAKDPKLYLDYFRWRNHYQVRKSHQHVCKLCEILHQNIHKVHKGFRNWWNPREIHSFGGELSRACPTESS